MTQATKTLFCQISKVDEETRTVVGIGASEMPDLEGMIFDYAGSKPYIEAWSGSAVARSNGKSFGNIREMHQPSAAGKLSEPILFDDANRLVVLTSFISDDEAWKKCLDGTYTGFSICGPVVGDMWADAGNPGLKRYICAPIEFSVCDLPCNPGAVFTAVKAGGVTEQRQFKAAEAVKEQPMPEVKAAKSMYSIQDLASVISSLRWTQDDLAYEADYEGDQSPIPDKLKAAVTNLCEILVELAREESAELVGAMKAAGEKAIQKRAQPVEVPAVDPAAKAAIEPQSQGASPENEETPMDEAQKAQLAKAAQDAAESLRIATETQTAVKALNESVAQGLDAVLKAVSAEPVAAKSAGTGVTAVPKAGDAVAAPAVKSTDPVEIAKSILAAPHRVSVDEANRLNLGR